MATEDAGIINYDLLSGKHKSLTQQPWAFGSITDFVKKDHSFWISSLRKGLIVYDENAGHLKLYDAEAGEALTSINDLYEDFEGNIWAGTKTDVLRTGGDNLEYIEDPAEGQHVNVLSLTVDDQDNLWYSTSEGLFRRQQEPGGNFSVVNILKNSPYSKYRVISLYADDENFIWAGLYGEGVLRIEPRTGKMKLISKELRNGNVLNIAGSGNTVWLATLGGASRIVIDKDALQIKNFTTADGLSSDYIYQVFVDSKGRTWFATDGKGVDMMDEKAFHHFERGLSSKVVFGVTEDLNHDIWANVQGDGLLKLEFDTFVQPHVKLRDNNITCLSADRFGNVVVMNDLGIDILRIKSNVVVSKGEESGIKNRVGNLNAVARDRNGYIFIGTDNGIIKYDGEYFNDSAVPRPFIRGMKVLNKNVTITDGLAFKYDQNSITIEYAGLWFENPGSLNFKYKLDNYDLDWISSHDLNVTYSSLPPGEYIFRLMTSDTEKFIHAREAVLKFVIHPPFWKTKLFYVILLATILALVYSVIKSRERKLKHDKKVLEQKVRERTLEIQQQKEEIQAQNEEIQAQNEEIITQAEEIQGINDNLEMLVQQRTRELEKKNKALEEYAFINAHELRAPVASILGLLDLLLRAESDEEIKKLTALLQESAERLNDVVRSITKAIERGDI
jgi:sugar lactone lactonase YvrE